MRSALPRTAGGLAVVAGTAVSLWLGGFTAAAATPARVTTQDGAAAGYALSLDGTTSSVVAADSPSLRIDSRNAFTVAFWTYLRRVDNSVLPRFWEKGSDYLCVMGDRTNKRFDTIGLEVANASGTGNANGGVSEFWGSTQLQTGRWYFIAVTFDGSRATGQAQIYVDGTLERMTAIYPWSGRLASTTDRGWYIGRRTKDLARVLDGEVDAMVVYGKALSPTQIRAIRFGRYPAGLSADWEFDEGPGPTAHDSSGHANGASITNTAWVPR